MKWFKHQADANMNSKLQEIIFDHGIEGYGLYWYCLELVAQNVTSDNLTFELKHDARIIGRNVGLPAKRVEEIMSAFIENDLFTASEGRIQCLKLAARCDDFTAKAVRQKGVKSLVNQSVGVCRSLSDKVPLEEEEEVRKEEEEKRKNMSSKHDSAVSEIFTYWKETMGKSANAKCTPKRKKKITERLKQGYTVDEIKQAIDGCKRSPHHMGANDTGTVYDDLELICRTGEKLEGFIDKNSNQQVGTAKRDVNAIGTDFTTPDDWTDIDYTNGGPHEPE